jgi:general secretion pathway protein G
MNRRRARSRGVTPVAAALAVFALGAGASGLWWAQSQNAVRDAQASSQSDANQIQLAAQSFRAQHSDGCPTLSQLEEEQFLDRGAREDDAWGNRFRLRCGDDDLVVSSAGPDGVRGDRDDIRAPR